MCEIRWCTDRSHTEAEENDMSDAAPRPVDGHTAAILRDRIANDSGARYSLDEVIAMFGFDPDELRAEAKAEAGS